MANAETLSTQSPETNDLEARLEANQKVLQALIVYMARREPGFLDHLRERFVEPMNTARREHHYRDSDGYAEEFIRAVMLLGEARAPWPWEPDRSIRQVRSPKAGRPASISAKRNTPPARVQVGVRNGTWAVNVDGGFRSAYHHKEQALAAAALLKLSLK